MMTAAECRADAEHLRELALLITDEKVLAEIRLLADALERLARELGNGSAESD
jgi:hypothetical protein